MIQNIRTYRSQAGATLPVAMFILLIVTLLAVSTIETSNVDLKIVQNEQNRLITEMAVARGVEQFLDDSTNFTTPTSQTYAITGGFNVSVERPYCVDEQEVSGFSSKATLVPQYNYWIVRACTTDPLSGARVVTETGVRMLMLADTCQPNTAVSPALC